MPNNPPSDLVVNFLVFQTPDIFTKLSGISVALISKGTCMVSTPCILSFWQLPEDCLLRGMKLRVANKCF